MKFRWLFAFFLWCFFAAPLQAPAQAQPTKDGFFLAIKFDRQNVSALVGDGIAWRILKQIPRSELGGQPIVFRAGKMSLKADNSDYSMAGEMGVCRLEKISAMAQTNPNYNSQAKSETVSPLLSPAPTKLAQSPRPETKIEWTDGQLKINAAANSAAFGEWLINPQIVDEALYSCRVWKSTDQGESWGPGLALLWSDGQFLLVNARLSGEWGISTRGGETIIRE